MSENHRWHMFLIFFGNMVVDLFSISQAIEYTGGVGMIRPGEKKSCVRKNEYSLWPYSW